MGCVMMKLRLLRKRSNAFMQSRHRLTFEHEFATIGLSLIVDSSEAIMINVNLQSAVGVLRDLRDHLRNIDLTEYPDEVRFCDAGKVGDHWSQFDDHATREYNKCFAHAKPDNADDWDAFDDILLAVQWVAEDKYSVVPRPPGELSPHLYFRRNLLDEAVGQKYDGGPAQLRLSTPGTYLGQRKDDYIHVKVERKLVGEARWSTDTSLGLKEALFILVHGHYRVGEFDIDKAECVFHRLN